MYKKENKKKNIKRRQHSFKQPYETQSNSITSMFVENVNNSNQNIKQTKTTTIEDIEVIHEFFKLKYNINDLTVTPANSNQTIKITYDNIKNFEMNTDVNDGISTINLTDDANNLFIGDFNTISGIMAGIITGITYSTQQ